MNKIIQEHKLKKFRNQTNKSKNWRNYRRIELLATTLHHLKSPEMEVTGELSCFRSTALLLPLSCCCCCAEEKKKQVRRAAEDGVGLRWWSALLLLLLDGAEEKGSRKEKERKEKGRKKEERKKTGGDNCFWPKLIFPFFFLNKNNNTKYLQPHKLIYTPLL